MTSDTKNHTRITVYGNGLEVEGRATYALGLPPQRRRGDIGGWSLASRRRLRQFLMRHDSPEGWQRFCCCLSIPPLPVGIAFPCATKEDAKSIFERFVKRCDRLGVCLVWRLEVQKRKNTKRVDIRGVEQPHWHCIGALPAGVSVADIRQMWLECLGERGRVFGADLHAVQVEAMGADYEAMRIRYLFDHTSKAKVEQVAKGWGRHWGVTQRKTWREAPSVVERLSQRELVWLLRFLRRACARRVPDRNSVGGIPWGDIDIQTTAKGSQLRFMGGSVWCAGWNGVGLPPLHYRRLIVQALGALKKNIFALKLGRCTRRAGQFFGISARVVECAISQAGERAKAPLGPV